MEWLPWVLAGFFAVLCIVLLIRGRGEAGKPVPAATQAATAPRDDGDAALRGLFRYLEEAVLAPLERARAGDDEDQPVEDAVNALQDLGFFARKRTHEVPGTENLGAVVQSVTREFALDTGIPVKFSAPTEILTAYMAPEGFKDALYLLLSNAGRFGKGSTVDVVVAPAGDQVKLTIGDRGPGFTQEAIYKAFEPFWTTESDALGLGLTHAKKVLDAQKSTITVRNRPGGGAEVEILLRRGNRG